MPRLRVAVIAAALLAATAAVPSLAGAPTAGSEAASAADTAAFFPGCAAPAAAPDLVVGRVTCQELASAAVGATTAFSYYVPPGCDPALGRRCPVIYALHGFGGTYRSILGTGDHPSAYVAALTSAPAVDPFTVDDPWNYADTAAWVPKPPIDAILVAPDGRTVPGGYGPAAGLDGFWTDWNPRYGQGGADPKYDTPPPRFETLLLDELIPYVEGHFPTGHGREWRSLTGVSLGGYGSYAIGLRHPDLFGSLGSVSGAMNFLFGPGFDGTGALAGGAGRQWSVLGGSPVIHLPGLGANVPVASLPSQVQGFGVALLALGDPVGDQAYFRGHMPRDLARNGYAHSRDGQVLDIRGFWNDAVAHDPADLADPGSVLGATALEALVFEMNQTQRVAFKDAGVRWSHALHPGTHSDEYRNAWLRDLLSKQYALLRHADGSGHPRQAATSFDYRSTDTAFDVWGWHVTVTRNSVEFLTLADVTCRHVTLRGTGRVYVTVPSACGTGLAGSRTFAVNLGPQHRTDEVGGVSGSDQYGRSVTVTLTPR